MNSRIYKLTGVVALALSAGLAVAAERETTFTYHGSGLLASIDGPRTDVSDLTTFDYDTGGNLVRITNALGQETNITAYDLNGHPLTIVDPNGTITTLTYDPRGRLLTQTTDGATTAYMYDKAGSVTRMTLPNGSFLSYTYDPAHRLTRIEDNAGNYVEFVLDAMSNVTQQNIKDSVGTTRNSTAYQYNLLSRLTQTTAGTSQRTVYTYDAQGNITTITLDPAGQSQTTTFTYDAFSRISEAKDAKGGITHYTYDARDNLLSVTDPRGLQTSYVYDGFDNLVQTSSPDTGVTNYTYDEAGNLLTRTDARGVVTQYSYDALNRLTSVSFPAGPEENITYEYDQAAGSYGIGLLTRQQDQSGSKEWVYDRRGNVIEERSTIGGRTYTTAYQYDLADILIQTTYPSGRVVSQQLNALGQAAQVETRAIAGGAATVLMNEISYLPFGPMQAFRQGNDLFTTATYDLAYRITGKQVAAQGGANAVLDLAYTYDGVGNIIDIVDSINAGSSQEFSYDRLNQLVSATGGYGVQEFGYDAVGNRVSSKFTVNGEVETRTYTYGTNNNRLLSISSEEELRTFLYDPVGNLIGDTRGAQADLRMEYNNQNRLIEVGSEAP